MYKLSILVLSVLMMVSVVAANDSDTMSDETLTNISFNMDEDGNLNPYIFIPLYYGSENQFYSAIGYSSSNTKEVEVLDAFKWS